MTKIPQTDSDLIGFHSHDHAGCIARNIQAAEEHCANAGVQLTPARRRVFEILLREHRALGAYEILDILREGGTRAQPPVAYRALNFLVAQGFVHRVEKLNAFIACAAPGETHMPTFLICRVCSFVAETQSNTASDALDASAQSSGFAIEAAVMEAEGVCPNCQNAQAT